MNSRNIIRYPLAAIGIAFVAVLIAMFGFERITTGEVGLRLNASKEIQSTELMPGSWNQIMFGSVITFPTKDIVVPVENKMPLTADNSALKDFDMTVVYAITPSSVSEMYSTKSKSFHATTDSGDILLMYNYIYLLVNNSASEQIRKYPALKVADNRERIENDIRMAVNTQLLADKLGTSIVLTVVQIRNIRPNDDILASATELVKRQNELAIKTTEVEIARKEAERMNALSVNADQSIAYMNAQAMQAISIGIKEGKVNTIVVPYDFKGMVNVTPK